MMTRYVIGLPATVSLVVEAKDPAELRREVERVVYQYGETPLVAAVPEEWAMEFWLSLVEEYRIEEEIEPDDPPEWKKHDPAIWPTERKRIELQGRRVQSPEELDEIAREEMYYALNNAEEREIRWPWRRYRTDVYRGQWGCGIYRRAGSTWELEEVIYPAEDHRLLPRR